MEAFAQRGSQSEQVEVCGLAVDRGHNRVWMADGVNGRYVYESDLATGKFLRKVRLIPEPQSQQGIFVAGNKMVISADDGNADNHESDNLYLAELRAGKETAEVRPFRRMIDFRRMGEIEGLNIDPSNDSLLVLSNRGARIELGMPQEFYDGYDREQPRCLFSRFTHLNRSIKIKTGGQQTLASCSVLYYFSGHK